MYFKRSHHLSVSQTFIDTYHSWHEHTQMIVAQEVDQNSPTCQRRMWRVRVGTRDAADSLSSTALPSGAASARERIRHACWTLKCCLPRNIPPTSQSSDSTSPDLSKPALPRRPPSFKCHGRRVEVCAWSVKCMQLETGLLGPTCRRLGKLQGSELLNGGGISSAPKVIFCEALLTFSAFSVKCLWRCVVNYGQRRSLTS